MSPLNAFLRRHQRVALDTSIFIYSLEKNLKYVEFSRKVLAWVGLPGHAAVTSAITMTELLVKPHRVLDEGGAERIYDLLSAYPNLEWIGLDLDVADLAARVRAVYRLKIADAIQAATAVRSGATALVTNDGIFERIPAFETLVLEKLL